MDIVSPPLFESNPEKRCTKCEQSYPATTEYFTPVKGGFKSWCKQCQAAYTAWYRTTHREEVRQSNARYVEEHKEQTRQRKAIYNAEHHEERKKYQAAWHDAHREEQREYCTNYNAEHHEERLMFGRRYREEKREARNAQAMQYRKTERGRMMHAMHENNRRSRKLSVEGTLNAEQIQGKLKSQKYRCYYCSAKFEKKDGKYLFHLEHTIPVSRTECEPRHDVNHVVLSCPTCNLKKNNKLPHEFFEGGRLL